MRGFRQLLTAHSQSRAPAQGATVKPKTVKPKAPKKGDPKTVNPKTTTASTPEGSATGWFSWPKFCWHNVLCTVFICLIAASAGGGAFAYLPSSVVVPDATALPTERGPLFAPHPSEKSHSVAESVLAEEDLDFDDEEGIELWELIGAARL